MLRSSLSVLRSSSALPRALPVVTRTVASSVSGRRSMSYVGQCDPQSSVGCSQIKTRVIQQALASGELSEDQPLGIFYNLTHYDREIAKLHSAFPKNWTHTMAVKANPTRALMERARRGGMGFESASLGELQQSLNVLPNGRETVVFDSPAKTRAELELALSRGVQVNLDNFQELARVDEIVKKAGGHNSAAFKDVGLNVGLRINPQVGVGSIKEFSTAGQMSKFGIPLAIPADSRAKIFQAYRDRPWLNGMHVHVGSQGIHMPLMIEGVQTMVNLALEINKVLGKRQIVNIDIGGGLSVNFEDERDDTELAITFGAYADMLKAKVPALFTGEYRVFTEFGRRINAKPGFIVSRVEYNKDAGGRNIALMHAGADLFVRTVWMATKWPIRVSVLDSKGNLKKTPRDQWISQDIAGPCCFAGDIIAHERMLPPIEQGDWVVAHDTGAYYLGSWSYYNSRQAPPVWGFEEPSFTGASFTANAYPRERLSLLKRGKTIAETLAFFE